ncbi:hypothetical protein [Rhizobium sp. AN80A]|uniref:hypothetical protein n=1 Tax=Rhizobium sp. AN80A TaxID=3040673 RepID=UPI0024B396AA|nr:hypothetical protein [Rhizobium sp. AN80A]
MIFAKLTSLTAVLLALGTTGAFASSQDTVDLVSRQMMKCLKIPADAPEAYSVNAVVVLKNGSADAVSINFRQMPSPWEQVAAPMIADAITRCEPYGSISERIELSVTPELVNAGAGR